MLSDDRLLLEAFRRGEHEALSRVYHAYASDIQGLLKSGFVEKTTGAFVWGIPDTAQRLDCLQDVFMRAFAPQARLAYDGIRSYRNFLMTICRNRLIDYWRMKSRDPVNKSLAVTESDFPENLEPHYLVDDPEAHENEEMRLHWQQCLDASDNYINGLDERTRRFITLRFRQELPQFDVAKQLGISRWKVRVLETKIQQKLKVYLQQKGLL